MVKRKKESDKRLQSIYANIEKISKTNYILQDKQIDNIFKKVFSYKSDPIIPDRCLTLITKRTNLKRDNVKNKFKIFLKKEEPEEKIEENKKEAKELTPKEKIKKSKEIKKSLDKIALETNEIDRDDLIRELGKKYPSRNINVFKREVKRIRDEVDKRKKVEEKKKEEERQKIIYGIPTPKPKTNKQEIILPVYDKSVSEFAEEVSEILKDKNKLFYRINSCDIVEVGKIKLHKTGKEKYTGFISVKPSRFVTLIEKYFDVGIEEYNKKYRQFEFKKKSISAELSNNLLCSEILEQALPQIERIFTIPYPILYEGKLTFPKKGFDERFSSWLPYDSPEITNPDMSLEKAREIIKDLFEEFCFKDEYDKIIAIAGLLTPFLKGLFPSFNTRTPVFFYIGNRERVGKDYLAGCTGILYEGHALEDPPVSYENTKYDNSEEELRKKITSAFMQGRQRMHFSNCKGFINNAVFEHLATTSVYRDRVLGKSKLVEFDNELCLSLSGNIGVGFTPDFANRCRFVNLAFFQEDANARTFKNPKLQEWVKENRELILSALYSLVRNWINNDTVKGKIPFTSYSAWSEICGGIMESAGYDNPCKSDKKTIAGLGGDMETENMKVLYELCYKKYPNQWIKQKDIRDIVNSNNLFNYLDLLEFSSNRSDFIKFGKILSKFIDRELSGIKFTILDEKAQSQWKEFKFEKQGEK